MTLLRSIMVCMAAAAIAIAGGCDRNGQSWSTKSDSMLRAGNPVLNAPGERPFDFDHETAEGSALREAAIELLKQASESSDPLLRANAIEAMHHAPEHLNPLVRRGLADENRGVRFIAAMTAGKFRMKELSHLVYPLLHDPSPSVQAAAIYAMHQCGERVDLNPLGEMLLSSDPEVKANAALVLGELGNQSAAPMLRSAVGRGLSRVSTARAQVVDLQLAESMVKLGDERQMEVIRAALFAPGEQGELIALACLMVGRLNDARAVPNLLQLATREGERRLPAEVRMAATLALAQIEGGDAPVEVPLDFVRHRQPELRAQAALTLGAVRDPRASSALRQLLSDQHPMVQVSAAGGILQREAR